MARLLMSHGANPNIVPRDGFQIGPFLKSAGNLPIMKMLLNLDHKYRYSFNWVKYIYMHNIFEFF